jgi:hypothetical protein
MWLSPPLRGEVVRRIQEKLPVEKSIWEPVSVPMARFIAFEQMAGSVRRKRRFRVRLDRNGRRTTKRESWKPSAAPVAGSDNLALDWRQDTSTIDLPLA